MDAVQELHGSDRARTFQMIRPVRRTSCIQESYYSPCFASSESSLGRNYGDRDSVAKDLLEEVGFDAESSVTYKAAGACRTDT